LEKSSFLKINLLFIVSKIFFSYPSWTTDRYPFSNEKQTLTDRQVFHTDLSRSPNLFWIPEKEDGKETCYLIECIHMALFGKKEMNDEWKNKSDESTEAIQKICEDYKIRIILFRFDDEQPKYTQIVRSYDFGFEKFRAFGFLCNEVNRAWGWLVPDKKGVLPLLDYKLCHCCARWRKYQRKTQKTDEEGKKNTFEYHIQNCFRCECGKSYETGDAHQMTCNRPAPRYDGSKINDCRIYEKSKSEKLSFKANYFCDFETFVDEEGNKDGKYNVYSCGLLTPLQLRSDKTKIWSGKNSFDEFMNYLLNQCNGVLWFWNGSRFDAIFMKRWLVERNIGIYDCLVTSSSILTFTFKTKNGRGSIVVKDLNRFLTGSLDENCKAFGIGKDQKKTDFEHSKIKTWKDVTTHKKEFEEYLRLDVVALRAIFIAYATEIWNLFHLHVSKFLTSAHLGYAIFTIMLKAQTEREGRTKPVLLKTPSNYEDFMRRYYRGGRIICGRKIWKTKRFDQWIEEYKTNGKVSQASYDSIKGYYVYADVNSLYPSAQFGVKYPVGEFKEIYDIEDSILEGLNNLEEKAKAIWMLRAAEVDVVCPKNLLIPFLMHRDKEGRSYQTLEDKTRQVYGGPCLWEAVRLGYKITKIHRIIEWSDQMELFTEYVDTFIKQKQAAEQDTPKYVTAKLGLNALTGKFGQKRISNQKMVISINDLPTIKDIPLQSFESIINEDGEIVAYLVQKKDEDDLPSPYPIHLSSTILENSKVIMSQLADEMGMYHDERYTAAYSDTDSYIVHQKAFARLDQKKWVGKNLGQLKLEVNGKIIGIIVIAPKTYMICYICAETLTINLKMRCKGIPHFPRAYDYFFDNQLKGDALEKARKELLHCYNRVPGTEPSEGVVFKKQRYAIIPMEKDIVDSRDRDQEWMKDIQFIHRLDWASLEGMITEKIKIDCIYPQMRRKALNHFTTDISIIPDYNTRCVFNQLWWNDEVVKPPKKERENAPKKEGRKAQRLYIPLEKRTDDYAYPTAYPLGHEKITNIQ
jgi:hypothetical protein